MYDGTLRNMAKHVKMQNLGSEGWGFESLQARMGSVTFSVAGLNPRCFDRRKPLFICRNNDDRTKRTVHARCVKRGKKGTWTDKPESGCWSGSGNRQPHSSERAPSGSGARAR